MNERRSDDDRETETPDPQETDERTPSPDGATDASGGPDDGPAGEAEDAPGSDSGQASGPDPGRRDGTAAGDPERGDDTAATDSAAPAAEDAGDTGAADASGRGSGDGGPEDAAAAGPPPRRGGNRVVAVALLIALAAAGAAGYLGWRVEKLERRVAAMPGEREAEREAALEPLAPRSELRALERQFEERLQAAVDDKAEALVSARDEALGEVRERLATLESGVEEIRELAARDQINWRLAEIRYLLAIAQRRVLIDRDVRSAIAALESADRAIGEFGDVRLLPLRQRIIDDLAALRSTKTADIEGIALRLQNLLGRVPELPAAGTASAVAADDGDGSAGWWDAMAARLDRFVTVRRRDAGPEPGRPQPATELPEGDRLVLALERARRAALARDPASYQRALSRAAEALGSGFAAGTPATERFREGLAWLRERPVEVDLPDLAPTVDLAERLSARIESSRDAPVEADPPAEEDASAGADAPVEEDASTSVDEAED